MSDDLTMRQDDRVTSVTFTLPAGHKWTSVEAAMKEAHDREYELRMAFFWEYQRLKAEVERSTAQYNGIIDTQLKVIDELKAEVERLNKPAVIGGYNISVYIRMANSETLEFDNGDIFADMTLPERIKYIVESHARLKAEVELLRKAGDMCDQLLACFEMEGRRGVNIGRDMWRAAKEGKQP